MSEQDQYKKLAKNTAVIGGSQVVQMLVTIIRTKVIAVLLGPAGMGVNSLVLSAVTMIQQFSAIGIFQSGVRDLSYAYNNSSAIRFARSRKVFNRLTLFSGLLGVVVCLVLSPLLSKFSFGDNSYTGYFAAASLTLLFMSLQSGKTTILQATQNLTLIAKATIVGAVLNLIVTIPMFFFWGMGGIVPAMVSGYAVFYLSNKYFEAKIIFAAVSPPTKLQIIAQSKPILKLGFVLMVGSLMIVSFTFLLNGFISRFGSVSDVGLFQAAAAICAQSMLIINSTLASDFFPRLSAIHADRALISSAVDKQAEVLLYIIAPISALLIAFAPLIVRLLFSQQFETIVPLLQTMSISLCFRLVWMLLGYLILATCDKKSYLIYDAVIGNGVSFILNIIAYYVFGLDGLGISYVVGTAFIVLLLSYVVYRQKGIIIGGRIIILFLGMTSLLVAIYISSLFFVGFWRYFFIYLLTMLVMCISLYNLNEKLGLISLIKNKLHK